MINGSGVVVHNSNDTPFALELIANHSTIEGQTNHGFALSYNNLFFKINTAQSGIEGRTARSIPPEFRWTKHINGCGKSWVGFGTVPTGEEQYLNLQYNDDMGCVWDRNYFLVATRKYNQKSLFESFFDSLQGRDMALWLSHGQFSISSKVSLFLAIKSKIPSSLIGEMKTYDSNVIQWRTDPKVSELLSKLRNAGRSYTDLQVVNKNSNGELVYWLNVYNTRTNTSGLYNQFEMDAWVNNQGPIVKGAAPLVRPQTNTPVVNTTPDNVLPVVPAVRATPHYMRWETVAPIRMNGR